MLGLQFGQLLGGAIITETVFAWPGVATLTVESIRNQDFPVVQCAVVLLALLIVAVNLIVDSSWGSSTRASTPPDGHDGTPTKIELAELGDGARRDAAAPGRRRCGACCACAGALAAAGILLLIVASAVLAPWIAPHDPLAVNIRHRLAPPAWMDGGSAENLLGTDQVGRDLLSRMIYGGRVSLVAGVAAVLMSATIGVLLGLGAGYFGGSIDWTIMTFVNVMLTFPFVLLALAVIAVLGPSLMNMIIVLGVAGWPIYARDHPRGDPGHPRAGVRRGRARARHEPPAHRLPPDRPQPRLGDRGDRRPCRWPR